jgi:O-antigen/teichoic acid export membrane protein
MTVNPNKDKTLSKLLSANLLIIAVDLLITFVKRSALPERVPFFYSRPWGQEQLAAKDFLFLIPLFSFLVFLLNYCLSVILLKREEKFLTVLSNCVALLFSALGAITLWKIIFLIS